MGDQLLFLRPRRFGKSLWLSTLENYYALDRADQFDALFGDLAIGRNPTDRHNQYFILRWNFSEVAATGTAEQIGQALHRHLNACVDRFNQRYAAWLPGPITTIPGDDLASATRAGEEPNGYSAALLNHWLWSRMNLIASLFKGM